MTQLVRMSDATVICAPDEAARLKLWEVRTGRRPPDDLSRVFAAVWGAANETFCLDWTAQENGWDIIDRQREVVHPRLGIVGHIDGYIKSIDAGIDNKVLNPFSRAEDVGGEPGFLRIYGPQCALYRASIPSREYLLNVQQGNFPPVVYKPNIDGIYTEQVEECMAAFIDCVKSDTPPSPLPAPPVPKELWVSIDFAAERLPNWAPEMKAHLERWQRTRADWAEHEAAKKDIKTLLPEHVGRITHGSITVSRARNGAISTREAA